MGAPKKFPIQPYLWPEKPICITAYALNAQKGETPDLLTPELQSLPAFNTPKNYTTAHNNGLPQTPCTHGHNTQTTLWRNTYVTSPLFVRDISGRTIHINAATTAPTTDGLFPQFCTEVTPNIQGANFIETTFMANFIPLEFSAPNAYHNHHQQQEFYPRTYQNPQHYPYKLRLDSFYQDGWRLPQTERLYVKPHPIAAAEKAAMQFLQHWQNRPTDQSYTEFVEKNDGETWFEQLFNQGVSIIPTLEAHNGYNIIGTNYTLTDFHAGRATQALHHITEQQQSNAPKGTILSVISPGLAYGTTVIKAKVIVSDGSGYTTFKTAPIPQRPNLTLPHPKLIPEAWQNYWLPTHPAHFAPPALFDWPTTKGQTTFKQTRGPVWEPLHYVYQSTAKILRAFRTPLTENPNLAPLPEDMLLQFHPIVALNTYDTFNEATQQERQNTGAHPITSIDRIPHARATNIGYHPLPENFLLHPPNTATTPCPKNLKPLIIPTITPTVTATTARGSVKTTSENLSFWHNEKYYTHAKPTWPNLTYGAAPLPIPYCDKGQLSQNVRRAVGGKIAKSDIETLGAKIYNAYYTFRKNSLAQRRTWYRENATTPE